MGFKLRGVIRCGRAGSRAGSRTPAWPGSARGPAAHRLQSPVQWECGTCHRPRGLAHACAPKSDFKARKRKAATAERRRRRKAVTARRAERRRLAAAQRRARDKARKALGTRKPGTSRQRGETHEPGTCGDRDCPKYGCKAYWQGMEDCPMPAR